MINSPIQLHNGAAHRTIESDNGIVVAHGGGVGGGGETGSIQIELQSNHVFCWLS